MGLITAIGFYDLVLGQFIPSLPTVTEFINSFAPIFSWRIWVFVLMVLVLFAVLEGSYQLHKRTVKDAQDELLKVENERAKLETDLLSEIGKLSSRIESLEDERIPRISVTPIGGHRFDQWEHEHLMWAELKVTNISPSLTLKDAEVRIVNLLNVEEKQDETGSYILFSLHKWNPIQVYWSERNATPRQLKLDIPPNTSRIALIAYSDDSNGPPAVLNTPTSEKPLIFSSGHKIDIEISSPNSAVWKGEFYIQCHGKYVTKGFPYCTEATFEFEIWNRWLNKKGITNVSILDRGDSETE